MPKIDRQLTVEIRPRERLAINLFDLDRINLTIRGMLLADKLDASRAIPMDRDRGDERAVEFSCDLLTAATVCDTIRSHDRKAGEAPTRVYLWRGSWSKLGGSVVLTQLMGDGRCRLSPEFFASEPKSAVAPEVGPVSLKG